MAIQDPWKRKTYPDVVQIGDGCHFHLRQLRDLLRPRENVSPHREPENRVFSGSDVTSGTIMANTTMEADALATSVCIMTPSQGTEFVNGLSACESLVIGKDGALWKSKGWKSAAI